jgi:peptidoglycan/xylan/chitin deacetylase (PgdA/CDA1 family)
MRIPGVKTVKKMSRWMKARVLGGAVILGYHRIASVSNDAYDVCITPDHFAEQMDVLSRHTHVIHLSQLIQHLKNRSLPPHTVAVTFDDGYVDNLHQAKPIMEKYGVPATIFVCSGYIGREFWWDELERLIQSSNTNQMEFNLQVGDKSFKWHQPAIRPNAQNGLDATLRNQLRQALYHFLLPLDLTPREDAMDAIRSWAHAAEIDAPDSAMDNNELLQLTQSELVEIGSHTRNHPMLPHLSVERQREEILQGKQDLETLLGRRIPGFAYPNGKATSDAKEIVQDVGFEYACTSLHDVVRYSSDRFELTRFWQEDVDGETFLRNLNRWITIKKHYA